MTTTINADDGVVSGSAGLKYSSDSSGVLALQTNGTTAISIGTNQNVNFTGTAQRITGDFSNATVANRVIFQSSTTNGSTNVSLIPNGTSTFSGLNVFANSDTTNTAFGSFGTRDSGTNVSLRSEITGTGTYLPMTFYTGGSERVRIDTSGNLLVTNAAGLGYGTGSGGTVTQATNKSTAVTLNKPTGRITMNNAALGAGASVNFSLTNSLVATTDLVIVNCSANSAYQVVCQSCGVGSATIRITNITGGSLSEAVGINFAIIKGATS